MTDDRNYFGVPIPPTLEELKSPAYQEKLWQAKIKMVKELRDEIRKIPVIPRPKNVLQVHFKRSYGPRKPAVHMSCEMMRELLITTGSLEEAAKLSGMTKDAFRRRAVGYGFIKYQVAVSV